MEERVRVEEGQHRIVVTDVRNLLPRDAELVFQAAHLRVAALPRDGSLLSLILVKGLRFDVQLLDKMKEVGRAGAPWVRATAMAGMSAIGRVVFRAIAPLTGRRIAAFDSEEEARRWLTEQIARPS
jgi:hypothetical protein